MWSFDNLRNGIWSTRGPGAYMLWPLSIAYRAGMACRSIAYRSGWFKVHRFAVPVIVVGNISVGGTGKTPAVIAIARFLLEKGWSPGVVSRGYGGAVETTPRTVHRESNPAQVGDEPVLIARRTRCPVVVAPDRPAAVGRLLEDFNCDVVIADDGLQHLALHRDIEIAMVGGNRGFGNGFCLPSGPLREPVARLESVDFVVHNGGRGEGYRFTIEGDTCLNLTDHHACRSLHEFRGCQVHAVAAIGNPARFFEHLRQAGLEITEHPFPDHYRFIEPDIQFGDDLPVLMTEKDAVKCEDFADRNMWYVPVEAKLDPVFCTELIKRLDNL